MNFKINDKYSVQIDEEDLPKILKLKWTVNVEHGRPYARACSEGKKIRMHRLLLTLTDPKIFVDHIDRDTLNNTKANLRVCTNAENLYNRVANKNNPTKFKGVTLFKRKRSRLRYRARISINNKSISLGLFDTPIEAAKAYNEAALKLHGAFACLNVIP